MPRALTDAEKKDIAPGQHHCRPCGAVTTWELIGGRMQRCEGCKDRFPCASPKCGHQDCNLARTRVGK